MHVEEEAREDNRVPLSCNHEADLEVGDSNVLVSSRNCLVTKMENVNRSPAADSNQATADPKDAATPTEVTSPAERNELLCGTDGLPTIPGSTSFLPLPGSVEMLTTFMQDLYKSGRTEPDIWKKCEARWLQLFSLVEKQCQEQMTAQQEQLHQQIQLIQDEIKHLVKVQSSGPSWNLGAGDASGKLTNNLNHWGDVTGQQPRAYGTSKSNSNQCSSSWKSGMGLKVQESFSDSISATSGYVTTSVSEPNQGKCDQNATIPFSGPVPATSREHEDTGFRLTFKGSENMQSSEKSRPAFKPDQPYRDNALAEERPAHAVSSETSNANDLHESNCKPLTSWARKVKKSQPKKSSVEKEDCDNSMQRSNRTEKLSFDNIRSTSTPAFFLDRESDSPSSLFSTGSGLSYWKMDEKEMYHSLPKTFDSGLSNIISNALATQQTNTASESKLQSLKDIYESKQRMNEERPTWSPPDQSKQSHPPEVWTLDPTLHMKPGHQNPEPPSHGFFLPMGGKIEFTPDSILESSSCSRSDRESLSSASNRNSPALGGSPNFFLQNDVSPLDLRRNRPFQRETNANTNFQMQLSGTVMSPSESAIQTEDDRSSRTLTPSSAPQSPSQCGDDQEPDYNASISSLEHPVMLSRIRQNLREKHARHIADLRDYYESEIHNLKQQLDSNQTSPATEELRKSNQNLVARCDQLEDALTEASTRLRTLENKNNALEMQVADWRERFHAVTSTSNVLQERVEEMRTSNKEKDNSISRLKSRLKDLEEALQKSCALSDEKDVRIKREQKKFQDLLLEYESLGKEHERVKDTLSTTESRRVDANREISELKRTVSKLEAQLKQTENENIAKLRHIAEDHIRITNANRLRDSDVSRRKWLLPGSECSLFTGQPLEKEKPTLDNRLQESFLPDRFPSPPEKDVCRESFSTNMMSRKDAPIMRAFKEFEEANVLKSWRTQTEKMDTSNKSLHQRQMVGFIDPACNTTESPERCKEQKRTKRFSSPTGPRSSSLPPSSRRSTSCATPTKREIMLMPVSMKCSPKRSPKENFSPGLSQLLSNENSVTRFEVVHDDLHTSPSSFQGRSPRKKLQFMSPKEPEELAHPGMSPELVTCGPSSDEAVLKKEYYSPVSAAPYQTEFMYKSQMKSLAETERLFDELTQEKQQIEAALNRMPSSGGRVNLQAKYNKEALEDRLEKINRDLGSIRMTLKKFHVLRTSANT